jgi:hypothetical protein
MQKNCIQKIGRKNKIIKILEIDTFWTLSVKFIWKSVRDIGISCTYCLKPSTQPFQRKTHKNWLKYKNYINHITLFNITGGKIGVRGF